MSPRPHRRPRPEAEATGRAAAPGPLICLALLGLLLAEALLTPARRASAGIAPAEAVPAVVASYGDIGRLGVVVARQQRPATGMSVRAAEARRKRLAATWADNGAAASRPFPTASMVKLFMAEDILHRARTGQLTLRPDDRTLLREMIARSDDPAASTLWVRYDGARMVRDVVRRYDLPGTAPPPVPGQWGQTVTTAGDLGRFLSLLPAIAHPDDAAALLGWMAAATPIAADGFDQTFGLFGVPGRVGVKQGWMCCVDGNRHVHSVGVVRGTVVVLLSEVDADIGYDAARTALSAAAAALPVPEAS